MCSSGRLILLSVFRKHFFIVMHALCRCLHASHALLLLVSNDIYADWGAALFFSGWVGKCVLFLSGEYYRLYCFRARTVCAISEYWYYIVFYYSLFVFRLHAPYGRPYIVMLIFLISYQMLKATDTFHSSLIIMYFCSRLLQTSR